MKPILLGVINNAYLLVFIPVLVSFFKKERNSKSWKFLAAYIYVCFATEAAAKILWWFSVNNLLLLHIFILLEFLLLSLWYRSLFKTKNLRRAVAVLIVLFEGFSVINSFFIQSVQQFNSYSRFAECLFILFYSVSYFVENYTRNAGESPLKMPFFWVNAGMLIYFSGNFCLFVLSNYLLLQSKMVNLYVWAYHTLLLAFYYVLISVGIWKWQNR